MTIKYLTFEISSKCNMNCGFCFSDWRNQVFELSTNQAKEIITYMKNKGLEAINFTGGEPLLRKDLDELLKFSKEQGLTIILSTNGILLEEKLPLISNYVDYIGLPLDSYDEKTHNEIRPTTFTDNHYKTIIKLLDILKKYNIPVKINTIVTKKNYSKILDIGEIIPWKVISWKLSYFIPSAYGKENENEYYISLDDYNDLLNKCKAKYPNINIVSSLIHKGNIDCRIISVDGHHLSPKNEGLEDLGDILKLKEDEMIKGFNSVLNELNFKKTYSLNGRLK